MVLDFLSVPRSMGNPIQYLNSKHEPVVNSRSQLIKLINQNNNGVNDVFVSYNRFLSFVDRKPFQISVNKIFTDFDSHLQFPSDALIEIRKVIDYLDKISLPYLVVFSGSKGFHVYIPLKEKIYTNGSYLSDITRSIMLHLKRNLKLSTIDPSVATPTKLCRVLYSIHPKTGLHCSPLNPDWVREWDIKEIMDYARSPNGWRTDLLDGKKHLNLEEFIDYTGIDVEEEVAHGREQFALESENLTFSNPQDEFLAQLLHYPCLITAILGVENAVHYARVMCVLQLRRIGYSPAWIFKMFQQRKYADVRFEDVCRYQINSVYNSDYQFPSCKTIQSNGLCIGKSCKYFR